jgi:hypothetical protein
MINWLIARYHWVKALHASDKDNSEGALWHLQQVERLIGLARSQAAFKAQQLIVVRQYAAAEQLLSEIIQAIGTPRNADERYIQIVCQLWREENFRDIPEANRLWAEAMALDCSPALKRHVLLRQPPEFILGPPVEPTP